MKNFDQQEHPEILLGEVWITNETDDLYFQQLNFKTKRAGTVAYNIYGKPVYSLFPIFVQKIELDQRKKL